MNPVLNEKKNDTSNQNRELCFFTCEKNDTSNQKPQFEFRAKIPTFYSLQRRFAHIQREKFTQRVLLISEMEWNSFV